MATYLDFEEPIHALEEQINKAKEIGDTAELDMSDKVTELEVKLAETTKEIFSNSMVVAGATNEVSEIENLCYMGRENLSSWFSELDEKQANHLPNIMQSYNDALAKYCYNQLQNTNSKNVMVSLGLEEDYVNNFKKQQFPY